MNLTRRTDRDFYVGTINNLSELIRAAEAMLDEGAPANIQPTFEQGVLRVKDTNFKEKAWL